MGFALAAGCGGLGEEDGIGLELQHVSHVSPGREWSPKHKAHGSFKMGPDGLSSPTIDPDHTGTKYPRIWGQGNSEGNRHLPL